MEEVEEVVVGVGGFVFFGIGGDGVGVDVDGEDFFLGGVEWVEVECGFGESGFFVGFADGGVEGGFARVDVPAGLEPALEAVVEDEECAGVVWGEDEGAGGEVAVEIFAVGGVGVGGGEEVEGVVGAVGFGGEGFGEGLEEREVRGLGEVEVLDFLGDGFGVMGGRVDEDPVGLAFGEERVLGFGW